MICRTRQIRIVQYVAVNELHFFHNFKLELYSFCERCPYIINNMYVDKQIISLYIGEVGA